MAELVIGAITAATSAIGGLLGLGGTAAATAGAAGATATGLGALSGTFSTFAGLAQIGSGIAGLWSGFANAENQRFQAAADRLAGEETVADLMEQRNRTIANNMVIAAASGIDTSVGDPVDAAEKVKLDAERQIGTARSNAAIRASLRQSQARQAEIGGIASLFGGIAGGAKELASSRIADARRGV